MLALRSVTARTGTASWCSAPHATWRTSRQICPRTPLFSCFRLTGSDTSRRRPSQTSTASGNWTYLTTPSKAWRSVLFKEFLRACGPWTFQTTTSAAFPRTPSPNSTPVSACPTTPGTASALCRRC